MLSGLYNAAQGMALAEKRHEVTAQNLAHAHMPGYRRRVFTQTEFSKVLDANQAAQQQAAANAQAGDSNVAIPPNQGPAQIFSVVSDFSTGSMQATGRPLDIAIEGDGFFVVEGPQGPLYTRNGGFHINTQGEIVSVDGLPLQGNAGKLTVADNVSAEAITVSHDGQIFAGATSVGQLKIVVAQNPQALTEMGETLYAGSDAAGIRDTEVKVTQGFLEAANVTAVSELVNLLVASRQYEAAQKTLTAIDTAIRNRIDL